MTKKKQLASSAPWRGEEEVDEFADAKLKVTKNPGETPVMHVPRKKNVKSKNSKDEDDSLEIDPELRYSFQRNYQVENVKDNLGSLDPNPISFSIKLLGFVDVDDLPIRLKVVPHFPSNGHTFGVPDGFMWNNVAYLQAVEYARRLSMQFSIVNPKFLQRVFSIDTIVKPLPPAMGYNVSRNLHFFTRIFTQFFDPEGIANAQKSLGLGQEEKARRVR